MLSVFWSVTNGTATLPVMAQPASLPPAVSDLGRYEILFRLAAGGMAEVFVARQRGEGGFERPVAIKRMLAHLADDERFVAMFLDEAKLAACIGSPHVVQTLDVGLDDQGSPFIVMDLIIGLTLAQSLRAASAQKTHIPVAIAAEILAQAAEGLHDAHEACTPTGLPLEIVHRDISPQNVLIGIDGRARISDFGVARALARLTKTSTGEFKGKLSYFSPEQAEGKELDRRSDVFSLGIVAWETFVGARLFKSDNPLQVLDAIRNHQIPLVSELRQGIPDGIAKVIAQAVERDVSKRTQSAADFARQLRRAAEDAGVTSDSRTVGAFIKEVSGNVLEQMSKRISEAFQQRRGHDDTGRVSLVGGDKRAGGVSGVSTRSKQGQQDDSFRIDVAMDEKIAKGPDSDMPQTAVVKKGGSASGVLSAHSAHSQVTEPDQTRVSPEIAALEARQKLTFRLIVGAIVAACVAVGLYFATKSGTPETTVTNDPPAATTPTQVPAAPAAPAAVAEPAAPTIVQGGPTPAIAPPATEVTAPVAPTETSGSSRGSSSRHSGSSQAAVETTGRTPAIMLNPEPEQRQAPTQTAAAATATQEPARTTPEPERHEPATQTPTTPPAQTGTAPRRGPLLGTGSFDQFNPSR